MGIEEVGKGFAEIPLVFNDGDAEFLGGHRVGLAFEGQPPCEGNLGSGARFTG
jgi:hypothetical protein